MLVQAVLKHSLGKELIAVHHEVSGVALDQVIVPHDQHTVKRLACGEEAAIKPESIVQLIYTPTRYGDVVSVHEVTRVWYRSVPRGGKE